MLKWSSSRPKTIEVAQLTFTILHGVPPTKAAPSKTGRHILVYIYIYINKSTILRNNNKDNLLHYITDIYRVYSRVESLYCYNNNDLNTYIRDSSVVHFTAYVKIDCISFIVNSLLSWSMISCSSVLSGGMDNSDCRLRWPVCSPSKKLSCNVTSEIVI